MKKFSEMGVTYTPADGKKRFPGKVMRLSDIVNIPIEIHDFENRYRHQGGGRPLSGIIQISRNTGMGIVFYRFS